MPFEEDAIEISESFNEGVEPSFVELAGPAQLTLERIGSGDVEDAVCPDVGNVNLDECREGSNKLVVIATVCAAAFEGCAVSIQYMYLKIRLIDNVKLHMPLLVDALSLSCNFSPKEYVLYLNRYLAMRISQSRSTFTVMTFLSILMANSEGAIQRCQPVKIPSSP